jgi:transcriptional regulator with XRE-family HTH domain
MKLTLNQYLDELIVAAGLKNDAAFCRYCRVHPSTLSKIRNGRLPLTALLFCRLHERLGVTMAEIRAVVHAHDFACDLQED